MRADYIIEPPYLKEAKWMNVPILFEQLSVFAMNGTDARNFLENQIISTLPENNGVIYTAICNPKGRIQFTLFVLCEGTDFLVAVNNDLSDNFFHYISLRKFRMKFELKKSDFQLCFQPSDSLHFDASKVSFNKPGGSTTIASHDQFWQCMFAAELPWITQATSELYIPQHVNLDQKNIIAFDKGCYPGQEIIARLHYIGKVKKRMQLLKSELPYTTNLGQSVLLNPGNTKVEICSPSIGSNNEWLTQVICAID